MQQNNRKQQAAQPQSNGKTEQKREWVKSRLQLDFEEDMKKRGWTAEEIVFKKGFYESPVLNARWESYRDGYNLATKRANSHFILGRVDQEKKNICFSEAPIMHRDFQTCLGELNRLADKQPNDAFFMYQSIRMRKPRELRLDLFGAKISDNRQPIKAQGIEEQFKAIGETGGIVNRGDLSINTFEKEQVEAGSAHYPSNIYGQVSDYKPFPDIGEEILPEGLVMEKPHENYAAAACSDAIRHQQLHVHLEADDPDPAATIATTLAAKTIVLEDMDNLPAGIKRSEVLSAGSISFAPVEEASE